MARRRNFRRKRKNINYTKRRLLVGLIGLLAVTLVILLIVALSSGGNKNVSVDAEDEFDGMKFASGVMIEGIDVSEMEAADVRLALSNAEDKMRRNFPIEISLNDKTERISDADIDWRYNIDETIEKAIAIGNQGDKAQKTSEREKALAGEYTFKLESVYDAVKLSSAVDGVAAKLITEPVDASVSIDEEDNFTFTDEQPGLGADIETMRANVETMLDSKIISPIVLAGSVLEPKVTREYLRANIKKLGTFSTKFDGNGLDDPNRVANLIKAAELINKQVIQPGADWSINEILGPRTAERGWSEAGAIREGESVKEVGGGVCQISSTVFNAAVDAGLKIVKRSHHSWPVSYVKEGRDATISTGGPDLVLVNSYDMPVYVFAYCNKSDKKLWVNIWGPPKGFEKVEFKTQVTQELPPDTKAQVVFSDKIAPGEYIQVKPRKNKKVVERKLIYTYEDGTTKEEIWNTDTYPSMTGSYIAGVGTPLDSGGVPIGTLIKTQEDSSLYKPNTPKPTESVKPTDNASDGTPKPTNSSKPTEEPAPTAPPSTDPPTHEPTEPPPAEG